MKRRHARCRYFRGHTHYCPCARIYRQRPQETIVGLQTDKPLKRAMFPYGGFAYSKSAIEELRLQNGSGNRRLLQKAP